MRTVHIATRTRVDVECAIARGLRIERICEQLDVPPELVQAVWNNLDALERPNHGRALERVAIDAYGLWKRITVDTRRRAERAARVAARRAAA